MSIERHPHINAVGFALAVVKAYQEHMRGDAPNFPDDDVLALIQSFTSEISDLLDEKYDEMLLPSAVVNNCEDGSGYVEVLAGEIPQETEKLIRETLASVNRDILKVDTNGDDGLWWTHFQFRPQLNDEELRTVETKMRIN